MKKARTAAGKSRASAAGKRTSSAKSPRKKGVSVEDSVQAIAERLAALRALSPEKPHLFTVGATWSEEELVAFEQAHAISLPGEYRAYLACIGDGGAGFLWHDDACGGLRALRDLAPDARARLKLPFPLTAASRELPEGEPGLWELGATSDHCFAYLVVTGQAAGQIWVDGTPYDGSMKRDRQGFLAQQLAWLDAQLAREHDLKDPPSVERFLALSLIDRIDYLQIPKNTPLLVREDLAGPVSEVLTLSAANAYASKHGGSPCSELESIAWAAVRQAIRTTPRDGALLRVAASVFPVACAESHVSWHAVAQWHVALVQALAGDPEACLAGIARARAGGGGHAPSGDHAPYAVVEWMAALALGRAPTLSFGSGALGSDVVTSRDRNERRAMQRLALDLPATARERLFAEAPPVLLLNLLLYGFACHPDYIDLRRECIASLRERLGGVIAVLRAIAARAAAELDSPTPPLLGDGVAVVADFFTARGGWGDLPEAERDPAATRGLIVDAQRVAAAHNDAATARALAAFAETLAARS